MGAKGGPKTKVINVFSKKDIELLDKKSLPRHVAIIMDGNRRWEKKNRFLNLKQTLKGHFAGANALLDIVEAAKNIGIKVLTVWGFSTENWSRPKREVKALFNMFEIYFKENRQKMVDEGIKFDYIGDISPFPASLKEEIYLTQKATSKGKKIDFVVALNYGGRDDLKRGVQKMMDDGLQKTEITEEVIGRYLDTFHFGDPDLLIRTSGEMRVSNFLLWQIAYAEIYISDVLWPDFTPHHLLEAICHYQQRKRRFGK